MKYIILLFICLFLSCSHTNTHISTVTVNKSDIHFIEQWQKNGVKIVKIDTLKNGNLKVITKF
ncbi:MAG: hypothetical protein PHF86_11840 [Candidatus Nanoarchaeia archaeon]|nr:hypothetical protein [Candidatus Nanoarchaeia archaeon]